MPVHLQMKNGSIHNPTYPIGCQEKKEENKHIKPHFTKFRFFRGWLPFLL